MPLGRRLGRWSKIAALLLLAALLAGWRILIFRLEHTAPPSGPPPPVCGRYEPAYAQAVEKARLQVHGLMEERRIPGISAAAAVDGRVVWSEGFGYADRRTRRRVCPDVRFRIASVSKPLTATAVALLYQRGKLDLDAPVQRYVPGFPDKGHVITARLLAGHLGGIRHYHGPSEELNTTPYASVTESLRIFQNDPLIARPGTVFRYSSWGYTLLSAVVEGASGEDFPSFVKRHVLEPLRMERTMPEQAGMAASKVAAFYDLLPGGEIAEAPMVDMSPKWAAGGFLSTAEDLVRLGVAYTRTDFLQRRTIELLWTPQSRQFVVGYGMGWMVARDLHLRRAAFHFGATVGGTSFLVVYPDRKVSVAVLANLGHARFPFARLMGIINPFLEGR